MAVIRRACVPILAAALWTIVSGSSGAASDVTVEVSPNTIQLAPSESAQVLLTVNNGGGHAINGVMVSWSAQPGVVITPAALSADEIPAGGSAAWTLQVARDQTAFVPNAVPIRVDYNVGAAGARFLSTATLTIQDRASKAVADLVDLRLQGADTLEGGRAADIYAVVANKSSIPLRVLGFEVAVPKFVNPCVAGFTCGIPDRVQTTDDSQVFNIPIDAHLAPQETQIFTVRLSADPRVRPGPSSIGLRASIAWTEGGLLHVGSVAASTQLTLAVLGEKDILSVIGIPSLFLLPGFLVTVTFGLLWKYLSPKTDSVFLQPTTPGFWLVPISASLILIPLVYPTFPQGRAIILGTYSQTDIAVVWLEAIGLGVVVYAAWMVIIALWARWFIPSETDSIVEVLNKLGRNNESLVRPAVSVTLDGTTEVAYKLYDDTKRARIWVSPAINYSGPGEDALAADLRTKLTAALDRNDPAKTAESFKKSWDRLDPGWDAPGNARIKGPKPVPAATETGERRRIVQRRTV